MQAFRSAVLQHLRLTSMTATGGGRRPALCLCGVSQNVGSPANQDGGHDSSESVIRDRVIELVKKFDKIEANKVTETADFQKDLSLDSLDQVELVMAFEQEFSIEIPDDKADKLSCCADVAKYIIYESQSNNNS